MGREERPQCGRSIREIVDGGDGASMAWDVPCMREDSVGGVGRALIVGEQRRWRRRSVDGVAGASTRASMVWMECPWHRRWPGMHHVCVRRASVVRGGALVAWEYFQWCGRSVDG
jgi:hypothetical protein